MVPQFILAIASLIALTNACSCPRLTFKQLYDNADSVVIAKVINVKIIPTPQPLPCLTAIPPCLPPVRFFEPVIYKLRLSRLIKGCGPSSRPIFFARSAIPDGASCGVRLRRFGTYMINLRTEIQSPDIGVKSFSLTICDGSRLVSSLTLRQRRFLQIMSRKQASTCTHD